MLEFLNNFLATRQFIPHGHCYLWKPGLVGLHVVSDLLIALAYYSIPVMLVYLVHKRRDVPFHWIFLMFGAFIIACGTTHLMEVWTLWYPTYWLSGSIKVITAIISLYTAMELVPLLPKVLALPSPAQLKAANLALENEITSRKQVELELQKEQEFLKVLLDNLEAGIVACDDQGVLTLFNQATLKFHGLPEQPLPADQWAQHYNLYLPDGKTCMKKEDVPLFRALQGECVSNVEMMIVPKHGTARTLLTSGQALFDAQGKKLGAVVVLHDFTERKRAEEQIRTLNAELEQRVLERTAALSRSNEELASEIAERKRAESEIHRLNAELEQRVAMRTAQLAAANKELEAFSYSVSHDLRAPLRSIDGFSQALLEDYTDKLDALGQNYLSRVRAATQRMAQLIDDLLNLSRVTRSEMRHQEVDLSALALSIATELQKTQPERQVEFQITPGLVANGDGRLLRIVLENLLGNAWKFTGNHPRAHIEFGITEHSGTHAYFVRDDGTGFDMAYADKLFGAFQRLHAFHQFEGTGIGLATVQRIIHRHSGRVWAEGAVEQGATFYFTL
jgi:PAS domain S-box-containing protein